MEIRERREQVAGIETFWREAGETRTIYVHGSPTNCDDWLPFLERAGGVAIDLPGFGRSGKPAQFDYSIKGYGAWLEALRRQLGWDAYRLVVHDWGAVALAMSQAAPERVERLVVICAVPLLPGYRWHRLARVWRTPLLGELSMGVSTRRALRFLSREATAAAGPAPDELVDRVWAHFDHGTQRAILKLYRSAPPAALASAGTRLGEIRCPALVIWGADEPYLPTRFAHAYGDALGGEARVEVLAGARHWPWIDRPEVVGDVAGFLAGP